MSAHATAADGRPIRILTPDVRPRPAFPRWTLAVFGVATLMSALDARTGSDVLEALAVASVVAAMGAGCFLAAWLEEAVFLRYAGRPALVRLVASAAVALAAIFVALIGGLLVGWLAGLVDGEDWVPGASIVFGMWLAGAAFGTALIILIDAGVSLVVRDFRTRVVVAVLLLLLVALAASGVVAVGAQGLVEAITSGQSQHVLGMDLDISLNNVDEHDRDAIGFIAEEPLMLMTILMVLAGLFAIPPIMSACGKLAEAVMDRIHPLSAAMQQVATGNRDVHVEEAGSTDFIQVSRSFNGMVDALVQAEKMERAFGKYVSTKVLQRIKSQHGEALIPPSKREATVFFADIRGFTSMSEQLSPERMVEILNRYFERVVALVEEHDGYLNKFIGDAVVVVFNAPIDQPDHAERAVRCAIGLQRVVRELNESGAFPEIGALRVGVGVATGPMVCGNIGSTRQMEYTVIGDTVNLSSRLTGQAGGGEVWISERTAELLPSDVTRQALEPIKVKGKEKPVVPYRVWPRELVTA
ncbi:MAG: adenylate/guanylate cyclase domain-containing protein [Myxococcota bacterium]